MHDLCILRSVSNPTFHVCDSFGRNLGLEFTKTIFVMTHEMTHYVSCSVDYDSSGLNIPVHNVVKY